METLVKLRDLLEGQGEETLTFLAFIGFSTGFGLSGVILLVRTCGHFFRRMIDDIFLA